MVVVPGMGMRMGDMMHLSGCWVGGGHGGLKGVVGGICWLGWVVRVADMGVRVRTTVRMLRGRRMRVLVLVLVRV